MGTAPVGRLLLQFSLPALVGMLVSATYNIVDTAFVGRLGHEAIAALTLVWPVQLVMMAVSLGVGVGANSLIARSLGAGDHAAANRAGAQAILLSLVSGLVMMFVVLTWTDPILRLLGARPDTIGLSRDYIRTIVWGATTVFFPMVANNLIRAEGNPNLSMAIMIAGAVTNVVLDPLLIFGIGPFPAMGVGGAALATVIAQTLSTVLYVAYFISRASGYHFHPREFAPAPRLWSRIYAVGLPSMTIQLSGSVVTAVANNTVVRFGSMPLAASGVMFRLFSLAVMPCLGIGQGALPLIGYNFGARQRGRVRAVLVKAGLAATALTASFSVLLLLFPRLFVGLFSRDPVFTALAARALRIGATCFAGVGVSVIATSFFQGIGRALPAMLLSLTRQLILYLPALLILSRLFGLTGFWAALPVSDGLAAVAALVWTVVTLRRLGVPLFARSDRLVDEPTLAD